MAPEVTALQAGIEKSPLLSGSTCLRVNASIRIAADTRRVLYALSIPEYMEAWLQLPEMDRIECHPDKRSWDRFRIELFSSGATQKSIHGSCLLSKPDKITYLWETVCERDRAKSVVEIHLRGNLSRCTLQLLHSGLRNRAETEWHSTVWLRSLGKLRELMEGSRINC